MPPQPSPRFSQAPSSASGWHPTSAAAAPPTTERSNAYAAAAHGDLLRIDRLDDREVHGKKVRQLIVARGADYRLIRVFSNPMKADTDGDNLTDREEYTGSANKRHGRHKTDPLNYDTHGGHIKDGREVKLGSDPADAYSAPARQGSTSGHRLG
jgi:hypothetical protein